MSNSINDIRRTMGYPPADECPFCDLFERGRVRRTIGGIYFFTPLNPVVPGHMLFVPGVHLRSAWEDPALTGMTFQAAADYAASRTNVTRVDFNLIVNSGSNASQTVEHLHVHYVPRSENDGLKLPWTNQQTITEQNNAVFKDEIYNKSIFNRD